MEGEPEKNDKNQLYFNHMDFDLPIVRKFVNGID